MPNSKRTTRPITVRFTGEEEQRLRAGVVKRGCPSVSALIWEAVSKELGARDEASADAEQRIVATLERLGRDLSRSPRGQQALDSVAFDVDAYPVFHPVKAY
jgi:hypothetical protein